MVNLLPSIADIMPSLLDILRISWYTVFAMENATLRNRLKVARAEKNLSQQELANSAGVTRQTISSIETGQYCPSTLLAFTLAKRLDKRVDELFYLEERNENPIRAG
jgi:putative transcriptional regulator